RIANPRHGRLPVCATLVAASPRCAVSQDAILQDCALGGTPEHRQSLADLQSAIRQISNLRYAKQIPGGTPAPLLCYDAAGIRPRRSISFQIKTKLLANSPGLSASQRFRATGANQPPPSISSECSVNGPSAPQR